MEEDFSDIQKSFRDNKKQNLIPGGSGSSTSRDKNGNIKGLIKSVFSTSSLSSSLNKLASIGRSTSNSSRIMNNLETSARSLNKNNSLVMSSSSRNLPSRPSSSYISTMNEPQKKVETTVVKYPYVLDFKREVVMSYVMNTGYIGTYETHYKLLYNKTDKYVFVCYV